MTTYRTGNHCTIVRESTANLAATGSGLAAELVAVVVNGDQALAARICTLLNMQQDREDRWTDMEEERDPLSRPLSAPVSAEQSPVGGSGCTDAGERSGDPMAQAMRSVSIGPGSAEPAWHRGCSGCWRTSWYGTVI